MEKLIETEKAPLISIIVPIYRMEKYIRQCIDSILTQNITDFELILVDDGSPDRCPQICDEYADRDPRIRVVHKENAGVSAARNNGIKKSRAKYITFVDADDLLPPQALEKYMSCLESDEYDSVFGNHIQDYEGKRIFRKSRLGAGKYTYQELRDRIIDDGTLTGFLFGSVCGGVYRREIIACNGILFDENVRVNEDGLFNFKYLSKSNQICVIDEYVYIYRQWKAYSKNKRSLNRDDRFDACEQALKLYLETETHDFSMQLQYRKISILFWNAIRIQESACNWKEAKAYLRALLVANNISENSKVLNYSEMNIYKKVLFYNLKNNKLFLFYILTKYFVPIIKKFVNR